MTLSKAERQMMEAVLLLCGDKPSCLVSPAELVKHLDAPPPVEETLSSLKGEDYLDYIPSRRKGETVYVISLRARGVCYPQECRKERKQLVFRFLLAVGGAIVSFAVGLILKAVFR